MDCNQPCGVKREGHVLVNLGELDEQVTRLENEFGNLIADVQPVVRQVPDECKSPICSEPVPMSDVAARIGSVVNRVQMLRDNVSCLRECLDL